ncbi:response regulator [Winogradskyella sp. DF17]|jgi:DNA-binding LytR/AlgR family response regulator|uniref:Response regulator n=1 Tax=Winogradskyella pelagia TaxID=2819984 RepID=A0ABS3SZY3_9FLAO|nr:response regulator [Winogradskyella sp. DF17]MBO3116053.1 response regulator [Winogradskyella sp. DF17]
MNCIIVEDQLPAQRLLKQYIQDVGYLTLVGTYSNAIEAMSEIDRLEVQLIFLDIHLPKISGLDFLKTLNNSPQIILTTAFSEYALESYEFNVVDYLLKPFSFQRFLKALSKLKTFHTIEKKDLVVKEDVSVTKDIFFKSGYDYIRLILDEVNFIKSDLEYTEIHVKDKKYISTESLAHWAKELQAMGFIRVHKSYLINTSKILKLSGSMIYLDSGDIIPLGRAFKADFTEQFLK